MSRARLPAAAAALLALATSCALFQRGKSLEVDHYTPERPEIGVARRPGDGAPSLRLGHVASGPDLGERIAYRDGVYRVGYYEGRRWTDRPELYVRRTLAKALFEEGGFRRALSGEGPTLDVEVLSFEEVKSRAAHAAHIVLRIVVSIDRVLLEDTVEEYEPVVGGSFDDVVAAMAAALDRTTMEVRRRVATVLTRP